MRSRPAVARRKRPVELELPELALPPELLAGPVIEVWCSDHDTLLDSHGFLVRDYSDPEERWVVMCTVARRRWREARRKWAEQNGLDDRTMFRLVPDRAPWAWGRRD